MSEAEVNKALIWLHRYLEKAIPASCNFSDEIHKILSPLHRYLDPYYPHHLIIQDDTKTAWFVAYIASYLVCGKRIAVDLVAYLDRQVVRFLRTSSCLKFNDILPEVKGLSDEEKVGCYLSERYLLPFSAILHPGQGKYYSQRLLSLINRIIDTLHNTSRNINLSPAFEELLRFINEVLSRTPPTGNYPTGDITYTLDEILLLLDDLLGQLTCGQVMSDENLLRWKKTLSLKIRTLIILIKPESDDLRLHYHRKLVLVTLLAITPWLGQDSAYLHKSFQSLHQHLGFAQPITLDFLQSLLEDIETYLLLGKCNDYFQRIKKWEKACNLFFALHRERCFVYPNDNTSALNIQGTHDEFPIPYPLSSPSIEDNIPSPSPQQTNSRKDKHKPVKAKYPYLDNISSPNIQSPTYYPFPDFTSTSRSRTSCDAALTTLTT